MKSGVATTRPDADSEPSATTPLLHGHTPPRDPSLHLPLPADTPTLHHHHKAHPQFFLVVAIILCTLFLVSIGDFMNRAPLMRVQEDIVCRHYYKRTFPNDFNDPFEPIPEDRCKVPDVQAKLAMLRGWDQTLSCIPSIIMAVPYGVVADKYGRRPVLLLSLSGVVMALAWSEFVGYFSNIFAIEWMWASNVFLFIGGGGPVSKSTFFTIMADVASEDKRASVFFQCTAAYLIATVVAVPFSWYLMKSTNFVPLTISVGFITLAVLVILCCMPETLKRSDVADPAEDMPNSDVESSNEGGLLNSPKKRSLLSVVARKVEETRFIFASPMLAALAVSSLVQSMQAVSMQLLFQFASERFHWSLADSSFLIPLSSLANTFILIVIFPLLYSVLTSQFGLSAAVKDLIVTRGSIIFNILGALFIAASPSPVFLILALIIYSFGNGFPAAARSLITALVAPDQVARLYATLAIIDTIGSLVSGPILSEAYSWGLHLGGLWSGMGFVLIAGLFTVTCFPIFVFGLPVVEVEDN